MSRSLQSTLLFFFSLLLFVSCKTGGSDKDIISKEKMQQLLIDINVAEVYCTMVKDSAYTPGQKNTDSLALYYKDIFTHHKVTREEFERSLAWYKSRPDDMDSLVNGIMPVVERWQPAK